MRDPRYRFLVIIATILAVVDQAAKWAVVWYFENEMGSREIVVKGLFDLILTRNRGAAWSMFEGLEPDWLRVAFFIALSILAIVFIFYYASKAKPQQRLFLWGLGFVLGGAVGNLIDRVMAGSVVDYLEFYSRAPWLVSLFDCSKGWGCRFPAFNVADIAINIGVGCLLLDAVRATFRKPEPDAAPPTDPGPIDRASGASEEGERAGSRNGDQARMNPSEPPPAAPPPSDPAPVPPA